MKTIKKAKEKAEEELAQLKFAQVIVSKWDIFMHAKIPAVLVGWNQRHRTWI